MERTLRQLAVSRKARLEAACYNVPMRTLSRRLALCSGILIALLGAGCSGVGSASGTGTGGTSGSGGQGGVKGSGGSIGSGGSGGSVGSGGTVPSGGSAASGGSVGTGGSQGTGGGAGSGGDADAGGAGASGAGSGGTRGGSGGTTGETGSVGTGGAGMGGAGTGGAGMGGAGTGGAGGAGTGGAGGAGTGGAGTGGSTGTGGRTGGTGGSTGTGGRTTGTGGAGGTGGTSRTGGASGTGGTSATGGGSGTGGTQMQPFKGIAGGACKVRTAMGVSWYYNWSGSENEACAAPNGVEYVPMIWGADTAANIQTSVAGFVSKGYKYVLGFNEPDNTTQSNVAVASALALLPAFDSAAAIAVGTPATQANTTGQAWFTQYMAGVAASTTLRADFIAIHWYGWNAGSCDAAASQLESYIKYAEAFPGNRPIWLTEWGCLNQSAPTAAGVIAFFQGALAVFAKHPRLARYAWYQWSPNCEVYNTDDTLTALGQVYAAAPAKK